jgi:type I restriction-modification system DNA methylase subunit
LSAQGRILEWANNILREEKLPFDGIDQELLVAEPGKTRRPDLVLWEKRHVKAALLIEFKPPEHDPWGEALDDALAKASRFPGGIPFIATWNVNRFYSWDMREGGDVFDKLWYPHAGAREDVARIRSLSEFDRAEQQLRSFLRDFLREFADVYQGIRPKPSLAIDERFIFRLRSTIDALAIPVFNMLNVKYSKESAFGEKLRKWFTEQGWSFTASEDDFEKMARQYVYLLVDKIMFYYILRVKLPKRLREIIIPPEVSGERFKVVLQGYFNAAMEKDYETIFATDFLDSIEPPDDAVGLLASFASKMSEYDLEKAGRYEVLGRVFERLIPEIERHKLGQYFTRSDVVDLIIGLTVRSVDDVVLDGAAGAGTFLLRSYMKKRMMNPTKTHRELLDELYGIDIAKFPAHLSTINLVTRDLSETDNYPRIINKDFFKVSPGMQVEILSQEAPAGAMGKVQMTIRLPNFDAIVMNPPYTRQEEMEDILSEEKDLAYRVCMLDWMNLSTGLYKLGMNPSLSKRSSIYAYFFIHAASFLKEGSRLGFVTSNSWLDTDYGYDLQRFFLENFRIVTVIESKVERWFEDADVNTAITVIQRCSERSEREANIVRFAYLKRPLRELTPSTDDEKMRQNTVQSLIDRILSIETYSDDEVVRVFPKGQVELWNEGYDLEAGSYIGSKWGKYVRAPDIFFRILEKGKGLLVALSSVADIRFGMKTGANEFFYLTEDEIKKYKIETEFWTHMERGKSVPNYVVKSPKEVPSVLANRRNLRRIALLIHKDKRSLKGTNVLRYIRLGESKGYNRRPTCASRERWYELPELPSADILFRQFFDVTFNFPLKLDETVVDHTFYYLCMKEKKHARAIAAILNSTLYALIVELYGRTVMGQGVLIAYGPEMRPIPMIDPQELETATVRKLDRLLEKLSARKIESVFGELGASSPENVSLDSVKNDRRKLDKLVMGDILGLCDEDQLEVYRSLVDLVKSRIEKAKSVRKQKKIGGIDIDSLAESILDEVGERLKPFPENFVDESAKRKRIVMPEGTAEAGSDLFGDYVRVGSEEIRCRSIEEARFIQYAVMNGRRVFDMPLDKQILHNAVKRYGKILGDVKRTISKFAEGSVSGVKLRKRIKTELWRKVTLRLQDFSKST